LIFIFLSMIFCTWQFESFLFYLSCFSLFILFLASFISTSQHWKVFQFKDQHLFFRIFLFAFLSSEFLSCDMKHGFQLLFFTGLFHHTLLPSLFLVGFWVMFVIEGFRYYLFDLRWQAQHIALLHILVSPAQGPCNLRVEL